MRGGQGWCPEDRTAPLHIRPRDDVDRLTVALSRRGPEAEEMKGEIHDTGRKAKECIGTSIEGV